MIVLILVREETRSKPLAGSSFGSSLKVERLEVAAEKRMGLLDYYYFAVTNYGGVKVMEERNYISAVKHSEFKKVIGGHFKP